MSDEFRPAPASDRVSALVHPAVGYGLVAAVALAFLVGARGLAFWAEAGLGPGVFPTVLAAVLLVMALGGLVVELLSHRRAAANGGAWPTLPDDVWRIEWRPLTVISLSILVFALSIRSVGLVPASAATAFVAGLSGDDGPSLRLAALAVGVAALVAAIFLGGLGLRIPALSLPA